MVGQFVEKLRVFLKKRAFLAAGLMAVFLISPTEAKINDSQVKEIKDILRECLMSDIKHSNFSLDNRSYFFDTEIVW